MSNGLVEYFSDLPDPRVRGRTDYPLIEIVFLCISAIVSGFDGWEATDAKSNEITAISQRLDILELKRR